MYTYSAMQWILVFYLYCVLGWCFETTVVSVQQRHFVNRGFLRGPMLPIYGFGATMLLHIALPLAGRPLHMFVASMLAATVFEYVVGVLMETLFKVKYWDYSGHRFQFQGRICLQSSLCWGVLGLILADFIHKPVNFIVMALPVWATIALVAVWTVLFMGDVAVSVRTALDLAKLLEELDKLREQAEQVQQQMTESAKVTLTNLSYAMDEKRGEWTEKMDDARERFADRMDDAREQFADAKEQLQAKLEELQRSFDERANTGRVRRVRKSLLRGNPNASSKRYDAVLQHLKEQARSYKRR